MAAELQRQQYTKHETAVRLRSYAVVNDYLTRTEYRNLVSVAAELDDEADVDPVCHALQRFDE